MMALRSLTIAGVLAIVAAGSIGCSSVQRGTAAGGAVGAGVGMAVSQGVSGLTLAQGAAIGGGTGAATGGLAGDAYELLTKDDVEREIENLRAELRAKEAELADLRTSGGSPETLARLEDTKNQLEKALSMLETARGERNAAEAELAGAQTELGRLRSELALAQSKATDAGNQLASLQSGTSRDAAEAAAAKASLAAAQAELNRAKADADAARARAEELARQLDEANGTLASARGELQTIQASLDRKAEDMESLRRELSDLNVQLDETSRGLTLTIVNQLLFTPGQAELTSDGKELLGKVASIIEEKFPGRELLVEGHTDNQPIVHSGWYSNWELGAARSLAVVHELVDRHNFDPAMLSAASFGENRPADTNATAEGRAINRRSVIVILPEKTAIKRSQFAGL